MTLGTYTYVFAAALAFLETGAGVGLIAPGEVVVILSGAAAGRGEVEVLPLIALVWAAATVGDLVSFGLGRRLGRGFLLAHGRRVRLTPERLAWVERHFDRHGGKTLLVGRFIGPVRALAPFVAGASRMPLRRFGPLTATAAGLWAGACVLLGYASWRSIDAALELARRGSLGLGAAVAVAVLLAVALKRRRAGLRARPSTSTESSA